MSLVSCQDRCLLYPEMPSACSSHAERWAWLPTLALGLLSVFASGLGSLLFPIIIISNHSGVGLVGGLMDTEGRAIAVP